MELSLDPSKFTAGKKQAAEAMLQTRQEAEDAAKKIEAAGQRASEFFSQMKKTAVELFAVLAGGRGLKELIQDTTSTGTHLSRLSTVLGISGRDIDAWQGAVRRLGGSGEGITNVMRNLNSQLQELSLTGEAGQAVAYFRSLGIDVGGFGQNAKTADDILLQLADRLKGLDTRQAAQILKDLGADDATIALVLKGRDAIRAMLDEQKKAAGWTQQEIDASNRLQDRWSLFRDSFEKLWRIVQTQVEPIVTAFLNKLIELSTWAQDHPQLLDVVFGGATLMIARLTFGIGTSLVGALGMAGKSLTSFVALPAFGRILAVANALAIIGEIGNAKPEDFQENRGKAQSLWNKWFGGTFLEDDTKPGESWLGSKLFGHSSGTGGGVGDRPGLAAVMTPAETEAYIRKGAASRGIDPDIAVRVAMSEGGMGFKAGDENSSFGPFQLHYGGVSRKFPSRGLGDAFSMATGLDARDPASTQAQIDFALDQAKLHGWGQWYGWQGTPWAGISAPGAGPVAGAAGGNTTTNNHDVTIGAVTVNTNAKDADGISKDIGAALKRNALSGQANAGAW